MQRGYKDLIVWNKSVDLVEIIYLLTEKFPKKEIFGITQQIRRASVSVPSNIAEGWARNTPKSFIHFINIARGSLAELETQLIMSKRLKFISTEDESKVFELIDVISKMLNSLNSKLKKQVESAPA